MFITDTETRKPRRVALDEQIAFDRGHGHHTGRVITICREGARVEFFDCNNRYRVLIFPHHVRAHAVAIREAA